MINSKYNETIKIEQNKVRRIIDLCVSKGIELYDMYNNGWSQAARTNQQRKNKQEKNYNARYKEWSDFTKSKIREIFLTPRMLIEFDEKNSFYTIPDSGTFDIKQHVEGVLANQIYFLETVLNECDNYNVVDDTPRKNVFAIKTAKKLFNIEYKFSFEMKRQEKEILN